MNERIAVIIPYFQRMPGLLSRALQSVFSQYNGKQMHVIVVDDESPVPAAAEIATLPDDDRARVHLITQANAGPAAARNRALDAIPDDCAFTALLDPDDVWAGHHMETAMAAMRLGFDFYFADHRRHDEASGYVGRTGLRPETQIAIAEVPDLFAFRDSFFDITLRHSPVGTSTVVYRRSRLGHLRFDETVQPVGDDLIFWMDAARATDRVAFGSRIGALYGAGVNLSVSEDWLGDKRLTILGAYEDCFLAVRRRYPLTREQERMVTGFVNGYHRTFVLTALRMISLRQWPDRALLRRYLFRQPWSLLSVPASAIATKLFGRTWR